MTTTLISPVRLWQLAVPLFAVLVGFVAGLAPGLGVAAAFAVGFVLLVVSDLALGVALFVGVAFIESIGAFGQISLAKAIGGLLALSWLAAISVDRDTGRRFARDHRMATIVLVLLGTWVATSALWAELPGTALGDSLRWIPNLALFFIVYTAVREPKHVRWIFALFVAGALVSAMLGLLTGSDSGGDRLGGSGLNANGLGELLTVAVILGAALGACRDISIPLRTAAFGAAGLALILLMMTVSRGALVGLAAALLLAPILVGPKRRGIAIVLVAATVATGFVYISAFAPRSAVEHITAGDATGSGRTDIWKVGLRMVRANPVIGIGAGNYANSTIHYLLEPGAIPRSDYIVDRPKVSHNIYLQVIAELGIVGLVLFLSVLLFAIRSAVSAARRFAKSGDRSMELLTRGLLIGLTGLLTSAVFSSAIYSKQLWTLLALCAAVAAMARERAPSEQLG